MGAHTMTLRLLSVAALAGAALIAVLGLSTGTMNAGIAVLGLALALVGVTVLVAQRRRAVAQPAGSARYMGRHRQV